MERPKCIFLDIDGTLIQHLGGLYEQIKFNPEVLDGTIETLSEWDNKGYYIILTTGRKEGLRKQTEEQLMKLGIIYDQLIMGIGGGTRVLINDKKPNSENDTAISINLKRNQGIKELKDL